MQWALASVRIEESWKFSCSDSVGPSNLVSPACNLLDVGELGVVQGRVNLKIGDLGRINVPTLEVDPRTGVAVERLDLETVRTTEPVEIAVLVLVVVRLDEDPRLGCWR